MHASKIAPARKDARASTVMLPRGRSERSSVNGPAPGPDVHRVQAPRWKRETPALPCVRVAGASALRSADGADGEAPVASGASQDSKLMAQHQILDRQLAVRGP